MLTFDLHPAGALHIGDSIGVDREGVQTHIPSDTLFAACVTAWRTRFGPVEAEQRVAAVCADPRLLRLTSAFPRMGRVRLLPMPLGVRVVLKDETLLEGKRRKRIRWVSEAIFDALVEAKPMDQHLSAECFAQGGSVWLTVQEAVTLSVELGQPLGELRAWAQQVVPRVAIDRRTQASNLFHSGRLVFARRCGLWLAALGPHAVWVREALDLLQDSGIGGLRSIGHGAFAFDGAESKDWPIPAGDYGVALARFAPADVEDVQSSLKAPHSAYALTLVGGWCVDAQGRSWRRRSVRMVDEGALLGARARGAVIDVRPTDVVNHPVLRYGAAVLRSIRKEAVAA